MGDHSHTHFKRIDPRAAREHLVLLSVEWPRCPLSAPVCQIRDRRTASTPVDARIITMSLKCHRQSLFTPHQPPQAQHV